MFDARKFSSLLSLPVSFFASLGGWFFIAPIALLVPRRKDWVAVIGREDGKFLDNAKYFFLHADLLEPYKRFVFLTERSDVRKIIVGGGMQAICYPSLSGAWFMLRCGTVVIDEASWYRRLRFFWLIGANSIQLWHGVGCKWIEAKLWEHQTGRFKWFSHPIIRNFRVLAYIVTGRRVNYSAVITTSRFYCDVVFRPAFKAKNFLVAGYPRNNFAIGLGDKYKALAWCNVDCYVKDRLAEWLSFDRRLVMIAPTFRDSGGSPMQLSRESLEKMDRFAESNNVEFIFKFHPSEKGSDRIKGRHFHVCDRDSDIYPLFPFLSALVTDYSSISMDFLLIDKPLFFLIPKNDDYIEKDRQLQFDPRSMMPGPIASSWNVLMSHMLKEWGCDSYKEERAALRDKAFDDLPQAEATSKIVTLMRKKCWVN